MSIKVQRRGVLLGGAAAAIATAAQPAAAQVKIGDAAEDDGLKPVATRAELEVIADLYVKALVAHDPGVAPFAPGAVFAENDQILPLGEASWKTIVRFGRYRHYFADPENGEVGLIANPYEVGGGCVFVLRLKVDQRHQIAEAEQFLARDRFGAAAYERLGAPDPVWLEPVPPQQRQSHEALRAVAFMYFEALQRNDGAGIYPFRDDCERIEHARPVVSQPVEEGYGHSDATTRFISLDARAQYRFGLMAFVTAIRDRRSLVVDVERGAILASGFYDYDGALHGIHWADGTDWTIPPYFRTSRSHHGNEGFKIINGSFRYIEMTFIEVPFNTQHAFAGPAMTVALDYDAPKPLPQPIAIPDGAGIERLTQRLLDAMVRNCPCDLPLATGARYTENGVVVEIGTGLWQSIDALRPYGIALADVAAGQGGWFGALDERTLFAMLALRFRVAGGLITEIEAVVVRPQKPAEGQALAAATFAMFTPPLEHDPDPAGFERPAAKLLSASPASSAILASAAGVHEAGLAGGGAAFIVRSNGHAIAAPGRLPAGVSARGHRLWLADTQRGLVLDLALRDNSGTVNGAPADRAAPWTDIHARLLKVEGGAPIHSEGLVARVPYGQGSGWDD